MGFLQGNNPTGGASAEQILAAIKNPGVGQGASLDDIVAMGNAPGGVQPPQASGNPLDEIIAAGNGGNILSSIASPPPASVEDPAPRRRMSTIDMIGRIADTFAKVGGADALYQQNQDATRERERQALDDSWKEKFNVQKLTAGANELQQATAQRFGQAARGLNAVFQQSGAPGVQKAWPMIAKRLGFTDEEAADFGAQLAQDPEGTLPALDEGLNGATGSQPKEITIYKMLQRQDPTGQMAKTYLEQVTKGEMNPYQAAQIQLRQMDDARDARRDAEDRRRDNRDYRLRVREVENKEAKAAGGGSDLTPTQRGNVSMKLKTLPTLKAQIARVKQLNSELAAEGSNYTGFLGGKIPGAVAGGKAAQYDSAVAQLRSTIRQFTRTPGEGSISDYETRLNGMMLPERDQADTARTEGISGLEQLVNGIESGYTDLLGSSSAPARRSSAPRRVLKPRANSGKSSKPSVSNW